jgi:hypothetical protein
VVPQRQAEYRTYRRRGVGTSREEVNRRTCHSRPGATVRIPEFAGLSSAPAAELDVRQERRKGLSFPGGRFAIGAAERKVVFRKALGARRSERRCA